MAGRNSRVVWKELKLWIVFTSLTFLPGGDGGFMGTQGGSQASPGSGKKVRFGACDGPLTEHRSHVGKLFCAGKQGPADHPSVDDPSVEGRDPGAPRRRVQGGRGRAAPGEDHRQHPERRGAVHFLQIRNRRLDWDHRGKWGANLKSGKSVPFSQFV